MGEINSVESFQGAIVVVDALGTKERWIKEDQHDYFSKYKDIIKDLRDVLDSIPKILNYDNQLIFPYLITVSDTIIAIFRGARDLALYHAGIWSTYLVSLGINNQIFFRGAIGYGDILFDEKDKIIMGSTIDEVGEWYDKGQIIGIYTCPSALFYDFGNHKYPSNESIFVKHSVKLKNAYEYICWLTNWPSFLKHMYDEMPESEVPKPDFQSYIERKFSGSNRINDFNKIQYSLNFLNSRVPFESSKDYG